MTVQSWDFYDTLITRLVARPTDVFRIMEERMNSPGLAKKRIAAESTARRKAPGREVTLRQIYDCLDLSPDVRTSTLQLELDLERALAAPIAENLNRVQGEDILVSDTYMPSEELRAVLERHSETPPEKLWVSSEEGVRKHEGFLWDRVIEQHGQGLVHTGDNVISDEHQPSRRGLKTHGFRSSDLCTGEAYMARGGIDGSVLAGCSRAARLSMALDADDPRAALCETIASVYAPIFVAFADWTFAQAAERKANQVLFMARDGQLLFHTAQSLAPHRPNAPVDMRYFYGSRRALHLPGFDNIESATHWLLENTPVLRLKDLSDRAGLAIDQVEEIARDHGFDDAESNIQATERANLMNVVQDPRFVEALQAVSQAHWPAAFEYYYKLGFGKHPVLMVDVGWSGKMQASLSALIAKGIGAQPTIHGIYLSLSARAGAGPSNTLTGFLNTPPAVNPLDPYRGVIETVLQADHGTTIGFHDTNSQIGPTLGNPPDEATVKSVHFQRNVIKAFVSALAQAEQALGRPVRFDQELLMGNLMRKLRNPEQREALAFLQRTHAEGQVERDRIPLVRSVSRWTELMTRSGWGIWPEGTLSASGLRSGIPVARFARRIKSLMR